MPEIQSKIGWGYPVATEVFEKYPFVKEEWENAAEYEQHYIIFEDKRFEFCRIFDFEKRDMEKGGELRIKMGILRD